MFFLYICSVFKDQLRSILSYSLLIFPQENALWYLNTFNFGVSTTFFHFCSEVSFDPKFEVF